MYTRICTCEDKKARLDMYLRIIIIIIITTSSELATHPEEVRRQTQGWLYCGQPVESVSFLSTKE